MPSNETTPKGELIKEYLERFQLTPSLTIAKKIFEEHSLMFTNVETVRSLVRFYRGKQGEKKKASLGDKRFVDTGQRMELPPSKCKPYENFIMPTANNKILALFDIHLPFQDNGALKIALEYGAEHNANTVLLGGDICDFYELSWFNKEPRIATFREERELFWWLLEVIDSYMPNAKVYWQIGNHERRFENYLMSKAPEIYDTEEFQLDVLFKCAEYGVEYIADKRVIDVGKLRVLHGDEYGNAINTPVNAARNLFLKAKACAMQGHFHATSEHTETDIDGKVITCWSSGCLCGLHPKYRPLNKWNSGFAFIEWIPDGNFTIHNRRIVKGKIV